MTAYQVWAAVFTLSIGLFALWRKSITIDGLFALIFVCFTLILFEEVAFLWPLFFMFASSSILSKLEVGNNEKVKVKTGARDYKQAFANLGPAYVLAVVNHFFSNEIYVYSFIATVAAANADTWSSTIGSRSKREPVSIISFKRLNKGVSGGVSFVGTFAGVLGSAFIVVLSSVLPILKESSTVYLFIAFGIGVLSFLLDSVLGDLFQALYYSEKEKRFSEIKTKGFRLVKGFSSIDNDVVNFVSVLFAAISCCFVLLCLQK